LSTSAVLADLSPSWKQEVNRRLAAHLSRKGTSAAETNAPRLRPRLAQPGRRAAARVAARYAKAPSYSEMLANEARAAVRAAEAASRPHSRPRRQRVHPCRIGGRSVPERLWEPEPARYATPERVAEEPREAAVETVTPPLATTFAQSADKLSFAIQRDADMPVRAPAPEALHATRGRASSRVPSKMVAVGDNNAERQESCRRAWPSRLSNPPGPFAPTSSSFPANWWLPARSAHAWPMGQMPGPEMLWGS